MTKIKQTEPFVLTLIALVFVTSAYFYNGAHWSQNSRLDTIFSFVEPGPDRFTFKINAFIPLPEQNINNGDWSKYQDNYYSNKAPGPALLGIPAYGVLYFIESLMGLSYEDPYVAIANSYLINLFISVLGGIIAALSLYYSFICLGESRLKGFYFTLVLILASIMWPYSTQLWGHTTSAAFSLLGLFFILKGGSRAYFYSGLALGFAVLCDYLAAINVTYLVILGLVLTCCKNNTDKKQPPTHTAISLLMGGLGPLLFLLAYNWLLFGSPFTNSVMATNQVFLDQTKVMGSFGAFSFESFWQLTFGKYRGLFLSMPVLLMSALGFAFWIYNKKKDPLLWSCLAIIATQLFINASYHGWHGGATAAARYQIVSLPFWFIAFKEIPLHKVNILYKSLFILLSSLSCFNMFVISVVNPLVPDNHGNPIYSWTYKHFFREAFRTHHFPIRLQALDPQWSEYAHWSTFNLGELIGLQGFMSLVPFLILLLLILLTTICTRSSS